MRGPLDRSRESWEASKREVNRECGVIHTHHKGQVVNGRISKGTTGCSTCMTTLPEREGSKLVIMCQSSCSPMPTNSDSMAKDISGEESHLASDL